MIADLTDTAVRSDVAGLLVTTFVWTGHHDRLRALFEPLCPELAAHDESRLGSALWSLALVELAAGRFTLAGDLAKRSSEIFQLYGSDEDVPASIWALAATSAYRGDLTTANRLAAEGLRMAERSVPIFVVHFQGLIGQVAQWSGDSSTACTHFAAAERANELGAPAIQAWPAGGPTSARRCSPAGAPTKQPRCWTPGSATPCASAVRRCWPGRTAVVACLPRRRAMSAWRSPSSIRRRGSTPRSGTRSDAAAPY